MDRLLLWWVKEALDFLVVDIVWSCDEFASIDTFLDRFAFEVLDH